MGVHRYGLRDDQWERIEGMLPGRKGSVGRPAGDNRLFVEAVLYRYRAGIPWRDLPERFGDFRVVHTRFSRWARRGVWKKLFEHLARDADDDCPCPSAQRRGAEKGGCEQAIGRSKGGLSTKIHATVDALGNPLGFHLTGGQACDLEGADVLLPQLDADILLADKGFDADQRVLIPWQQAGKVAVIPPKANRKVQRDYDKELYKARHLIENFFAKLKLFRAIATRYDKTARNFLAAVYFAATLIWLI